MASGLLPALRSLLQGFGAVLLVLVAVLALLMVDGLLLIPALLLSYDLLGIAWQWQGFLPGPRQSPGPWTSLSLGLIASLLLALVDGLALGLWARYRRSG